MLLSSAGGTLFYKKKWDALTCGFPYYDLLKTIITPHKNIDNISPMKFKQIIKNNVIEREREKERQFEKYKQHIVYNINNICRQYKNFKMTIFLLFNHVLLVQRYI